MWNKAHQGFSPQSAFDELKISAVSNKNGDRGLVSPLTLTLLPRSLHSKILSSRCIADSQDPRSRYRRLSILLRMELTFRYPEGTNGQVLSIFKVGQREGFEFYEKGTAFNEEYYVEMRRYRILQDIQSYVSYIRDIYNKAIWSLCNSAFILD